MEAQTPYELGQLALNERRFEDATREFRAAVELDPEHAAAHRELGCVVFRLAEEGSLPRAKAHLERSLELDSMSHDSHLYLGLVLDRLAQKEEAEAHFRMALSLTVVPQTTHAAFAEFLWHNSRYGEAEEHFRIALDHDLNCEFACREYARMLACHGRDEGAKLLFEHARLLDPESKLGKRDYEAFLLELADESRDPDACLRAAIEKDPNYTLGIECLKRRG